MRTRSLRAMLQFWREGFGATSITDLETATGINRISICNAFDDKEALFQRALTQYNDNSRAYFLDPSFAEGGLVSITGLFDELAAELPADAPQHFGCLILNTILDINNVSDAARERVEACRNDMLEGLRRALAAADRSGEAPASRQEIADRAEFLVSVIWGARITARLKGDTQYGRRIAETLKSIVLSWRSADSNSVKQSNSGP